MHSKTLVNFNTFVERLEGALVHSIGLCLLALGFCFAHKEFPLAAKCFRALFALQILANLGYSTVPVRPHGAELLNRSDSEMLK